MTFRLEHPEPGPRRCAFCGRPTSRTKQHIGSRECQQKQLLLIAKRRDLVMVSGRERWILQRAGLPSLWIDTPEDERALDTDTPMRRRSKQPYAERWAARAVRKLSRLGDDRIIELLRQGSESGELQAELAVATLAPEEAW